MKEEELKEEIRYENGVTLNQFLPKVHPDLYKMWRGAIDAANSNNPDKIRHFTTSIRELFTQVIHTLAPDAEIKGWTSEKTMFHEGRPTRKARLSYIYRGISNDPFNKFIESDVDSTLKFLDVIQRGTHEIDPRFNEDQLLAIKSKAETTLRFILAIHFRK